MNAAAIVLWLCAFGAAPPPDVGAAYQRLDGVWDVQEVVRDGATVKDAGVARLIFHDGTVSFTPEVGGQAAGPYRLGLGPWQTIELPWDGQLTPAIYTIDPHGKLLLCFDHERRQRPSRFVSTAGTGWTLITLRKN